MARSNTPLGLRDQLIFALVVPAVVVLAAMAFFADVAVRRALDDSLGERLYTIAQAAAANVDPRVLLLDRGDDDSRLSRATKKKLLALIEASGVERIQIVRLTDKTALVDSQDSLRVGDEYVRARFDAAELEGVAAGKSAASVLFHGRDGRWYKTGYAPLYGEDEDRPGAAVVVNAPAHFFEVIDDLRSKVAAIALVGLLGLASLTFLSARRVSVPLSRLSEAAERIGRGELEAEIPAGGTREAAVLAETMRKMAASLRARDQEMQLMLAGIAHEVRNPLGGIELFGSLLREELDEADPRRGHTDRILKEIGVLAGVVNDFLAFARKQPLEPEQVEVSSLVEEVVMMAGADADGKNLSVQADVERGLVARLDPHAMNRALMNLVRNAIQATPEGGQVKVVARGEDGDGGLRLEVVDTGPGIPPEKRGEIFNPFYTTKQKGTGLGLALVKKSVDAHGGTVHVEEASGGGARFVIVLPAKVEHTNADPVEEPGMIG